jgi:hypothetical protein
VNLDAAGLLRPAESRTFIFDSEIKHPLPANRPYFSRKNIQQSFYDISDPNFRNAPETPPSMTAEVNLIDQGTPLSLTATVQDVVDTGNSQPAVVVPPLSIAVSPHVEIMTPGSLAVSASAVVKANTRQIVGLVSIDGPPGWDTFPPEQFGFASANEESRVELFTAPQEWEGQPLPALPKEIAPGTIYSISAVATVAEQQYREGYRSVGYPGLKYTNYYTPATFKAVALDVRTASNLHVAYLPGTGDDIPAALDQLAQLGVHTHILTIADLTPATLKPYDALILGVRAYEAHPELAAANSTLNAYATNGGIVIVQYVGRDLPAGSAPYPLSLGSNEKVVEEDAPVQILALTDPLLTWPNRITSADFDHWIEERGHGFMATWDPHYQALFETHDHGQLPQRGGLLIARTGHGAWIYLGLALYRQLPEGVPGAYRILANLISAAKYPGLRPTGAPMRSPMKVTK